jgi:bloom syndrome protein
VGKNYKAIIAGRQKIMMDFREASPRKEAVKTSKKRVSAGADETQGQIKFIAKKSNPVYRQRSIQQIQKETEDFDNSHWGDSDEDAEYAPDDPIEVDGDATDVEEDVPLKDAKRRRTTSGPSTAGPSRSAPAARQVVDLASASDLDRGNTMSPVDWAYKQLKEMYTKVSSSAWCSTGC